MMRQNFYFYVIFLSYKAIFLIRMVLKKLITKSLSIQANKKCTCAVSEKESDLL